MQTKLSIVRQHMRAGEWQDAIRLAARFPRLDHHRAAILDAHNAYTNPRFLVQLGRDLDALKAAGRQALIDRFGLE
jgi:5-carboxymethyl-2-hydroxymuconate isomerase